jgi:hypothetical protein
LVIGLVNFLPNNQSSAAYATIILKNLAIDNKMRNLQSFDAAMIYEPSNGHHQNYEERTLEKVTGNRGGQQMGWMNDGMVINY